MRKLLYGLSTLFVLVLIGFYLSRNVDGPQPTPTIATAPPPAVQPTPAQVAAPAGPPSFVLTSVAATSWQNGQRGVCLFFSRPLVLDGSADYGQFLTVDGGVPLKVRVTANQLCADGLVKADAYAVVAKTGLPSADGAKLAADVNATAKVDGEGGSSPVSFASAGVILPRIDGWGVPVTTNGKVDDVPITVFKFSDRTALFNQRAYSLTSARTLTRYDLALIGRTQASLVWQGKIDFSATPAGKAATIALDQVVTDRQPAAYLIVAGPFDARRIDDADYWGGREAWEAIPVQWVVQSDIGLTVLRGADGLTVNARSFTQAQPRPGIRMQLLSQANDVLAELVTDAQGLAKFAPGLLRGRGGAEATAVQAFGPDGDFAMLDLRRPAFDLSDRGVSGRTEPGPVDGYLYSDRGIYRPGETVNLVAQVRDRAGRITNAGPLTIKVQRPNGVEFRRWTVTPDDSGLAPLAITLPQAAMRGLWTAEIRIDPTADPVAKLDFDVQDFVPQRLKVEARAKTPFVRPGEALAVELDGMFLYGAPAADLVAQGEVKIEADPEPVANARGFRFGLFDDKIPDGVIALPDANTDSQGRVTLSAPLVLKAGSTKPLRAAVSVGLIEPGGRATTTSLAIPIRQRDLLLGIRPLFQNDRVGYEAGADFELRAFAPDGQPVERSVTVTVFKENWHYTWYRRDGEWRWETTVTDEVLKRETITLAAANVTRYRFDTKWSRYRLQVEDQQSGAASSVRFRSGWGDSDPNSDTPDTLQVSSDQPRYRAGETARVRIQPPGEGQVLITLATDRVLETRQIAVPKDGTEITIPVDAAWGTGAYALVSYFHQVGDDARLPARAVGLVWLGLDLSDRTLAVEMTAPDVMRPRQKLSLPVKVKGLGAGEKAVVTVAAVDEGILQLTRFQTPAPQTWFFSKRRLGVELRDDYARLMDGSGVPGRLRFGGDDIGGAGLAVVPTKTVSLFSGPVQVGADGQATIDFDVPDFNGQLRLMAVASSATKVGNGEGKVIVRDPVVAEVILPRFLAPGDQARLTLLLHNVDGAAGDYQVKLSADAPLTLTGTPPTTITLGAGERRIDTYPITAGDVGIGRVGLSVSGPGGFAVTRDWPLAVRSPFYPLTLVDTAPQADGASFTIDPKLADAFMPGSLSIAVNYSNVRGFDVPGLLQSLYRYPYGCSEQITSVALPLLFYNDPSLLALGGKVDDGVIRGRVQSAIATLLERQDATGRFGLWRAGDDADLFIHLYVTDFLTLAAKRNYEVPARAIDAAMDFARTRSQPDLSDAAYRAYLGARESSWMPELQRKGFEQASALAGSEAGAAQILSGHTTQADVFFADADRAIQSPRGFVYRDYYATPYRNVAGSIAMAAEAKQTKWLTPWLNALAKLDKSPKAMNSQEQAWALRAAAAMAQGGPVKLAVNGIEQASATAGPRSLNPTIDQVRAGYGVVNQSGHDVWRSLVLRGEPKIAPPPVAQGFSLTKTFYTLDGKPADPAQAKRNDRLVVVLSGAMTGSRPRQAVLVDMQPAGYEIEGILQARPDGSSPLSFVAPPHPTRVREARDDRVVVAFDLKQIDCQGDDCAKKPADWHQFTIAYTVRAVTPGQFVLPGAAVEDMYDPEFMARTAGGSVTIAN